MRIIRLLLLILLTILLTSCGSDLSENNIGIQIFDKNQNILTNYIPQKKTKISEIIGSEIKDNITLIRSNGELVDVTSNSFINKDKYSVFCIDENKNKINNIEGIYLSNNKNRITDAFFDTMDSFKENKKIMVFLLDGFSYQQYKFLEGEGKLPFLSEMFKHEALSVVTPVTNAGFAAIITGETPNINGVHDRSVRKMEVESIFHYGNDLGKKSILVEADIKILNTEIEPVLHFDINKDGDIDDEIFETTLGLIEEDYDFIFIHFHGIDDRGHSFGPFDQETLAYIEKIDGYIGEISSKWDHSMILTADHGMHETKEGGSHGVCRSEDMVVPYFIR